MVEFALVAPAFFIILLTTYELAFVINAQATIDNATRNGVRVGAICGNTKGVFVSPDGTVSGNTSGGAASSPCIQAITSEVKNDLGILQPAPGNPGIIAISPAAGSPSSCGTAPPPSNTWVTAAAGCVIDVQVSYRYSFLLDFIVGPVAPTIVLNSEATAVSQQ